MPRSSRDQPPVLSYASTGRPVADRFARWFVWPLPLWSALIITPAYVPHRQHPDDPFWFAAMALQVVVGLACVVRRQWGLACYCLALPVAIVVLTALLH